MPTDFTQYITERVLLTGRPVGVSSPEYHIGFGIDAAYLRPVGVLIASLSMLHPDITLSFHVLTLRLCETDLSLLRALAHRHRIQITVYQLNAEAFASLPTNRYFSTAVYYRLLVPKVTPAKQVLYLDSDMLCLGNIRPLLDTALDGYTMAVVGDLPDMTRTKMSELQIPTYFNSGMQLINVAAWNREEISERAVALLRDDARKLPFLDQDALNLLQAGKALMLDRRWNYLFLESREPDKLQEALSQAILLHCVAYPKPWMAFYDSPPVQELYLSAEQHTPWAGMPLQKPTLPYDIRRYARMLWRHRHYAHSVAQYLRYKRIKIQRASGMSPK